MIEIYTPAVRVVVVASLLLAIATMTFVTARAAGSCSHGSACAGDACEMMISTRRCAAYAVDFTVTSTPLTWAGLLGPALRKLPG